MKVRICALALVSITVCATAATNKHDDDVVYSASRESTSRGETIIRGGKATVTVRDLNWIRYHYQLLRKDDVIEEVDPLASLSLPTQIAGSAPSPAEDQPSSIGVRLAGCRMGVSSVDTLTRCSEVLLSAAQQLATELKDQLAKAAEMEKKVREFMRDASHGTAKSNAAVHIAATDQLLAMKLQSCGDLDAAECLKDMNDVNQRLREALATTGIREIAAEVDADRRADMERKLKDASSALSNAKDAIERSTKLWKDWDKYRVGLKSLRDHLSGPTPGVLQAFVGCHFSSPRRVTITLVRTDMLAEKGAKGSSDDPYKQDIVTYVCRATMNISGGMSFSNLDERKFKFVNAPPALPDAASAAQSSDEQGDGATAAPANVIGYERVSDFRTAPTVLAHVRLWDQEELGKLGFHFTFGTGLKTGGDGFDLEFLAGPSVSIAEKLFFTGGVQVGRVENLIEGFKIGTPQPTGLTEPPTQRSLRAGFGFALSWRIGGSAKPKEEE